MKIISWNVNGIRSIEKKDFIKSVNSMNPDILCLQETRGQDNEVLKVLIPLTNYLGYSNSGEKKGYSGTALLSKTKPIKIINNMGAAKINAEGRVICAEYSSFYLVNVYVPNSGQKLKRLKYREKWNANFLSYLKKIAKVKPIIVCGDFNVSHKPIDLENDTSNYNKTAGYTQIEIDGINDLISAGFIDAFRHLHPTKIAYSYWSYRFNSRAKNIGWRIDYFLVSKSLVNKIKTAQIFSEFLGSDHCPISLEINL